MNLRMRLKQPRVLRELEPASLRGSYTVMNEVTYRPSLSIPPAHALSSSSAKL